MTAPCTFYVCGFNAHGQLDRQLKPHDLKIFVKRLRHHDHQHLQNIQAFWATTVVSDDRGISLQGFQDSGDRIIKLGVSYDAVSPRKVFPFGDVSGARGAWDTEGSFYRLSNHRQDDGSNSWNFVLHKFEVDNFMGQRHPNVRSVAIAENDQVCVVTDHHLQTAEDEERRAELANGSDVIYLFSHFDALLSGSPCLATHRLDGPISMLGATSNTFIIQTESDAVFSFGDARYPNLLGRTPTAEQPAAEPCAITDLDSISVRKISCGKWMVAAITKDDDLYVWGPGKPGTKGGLENVGDGEGMIRPVDIDDVADVAVGDEHIIALTKLGDIWVHGSNEYGQLGLGHEVDDTRSKWVKLEKDIFARGYIDSVEAGPLNTFVKVRPRRIGHGKT
ncbi:MAG: hypothetical protein LQ351_001877 [Letrouitia transgressa]|nr:MAG: hypothetical protein LQ351_001877 [Letrouitia transgressa]